MKDITVKVYSFDELSPMAKKKAIELFHDINVDNEDPYILEVEANVLEKLGYNDAKINYSGFWSQGDGACFECTVDIKKWIQVHKAYKEYRKLYNQAANCNLVINTNGRYYHEMTMYTNSEAYGMTEDVQEQLSKLEIDVIKDARDEARRIYKTLEKDYEYNTSDEVIIEGIKANDYDFTIDGERKVYL